MRDFDFDFAAEVVEEVAELVEDGFDFAVCEQGGLVADGGGEVSADEAEVRGAFLVAVAGDEVVHPRATALGFAGVPVGVEGAELLVGFAVEEVVEFDFFVPDFIRDARDGRGWMPEGRPPGIPFVKISNHVPMRSPKSSWAMSNMPR